MNLEQFLKERTNKRIGKYRTVNVDEHLHLFYKRISSHYNIPMADLMYHILEDWKSKYEVELKKKMLNDL